MRVSDALQTKGIVKADAEVLLSTLLMHDRAWLLGHGDDPLTTAQEHLWTLWSQRRMAGEPVSYITQEREFFGRSYVVDARVMIPRPATESLVDLALRTFDNPKSLTEVLDQDVIGAARVLRADKAPRLVVDVGTGSGCIGISLACERPSLRVILTDISQEALDVAAHNAERHGVSNRVTTLLGDGLAPMKDIVEPFLLVSNPPYIPDDHRLPQDVAHYEPALALRGGGDGSDLVRQFCEQAKAHPACVAVVMECRSDQQSVVDAATGVTS